MTHAGIECFLAVCRHKSVSKAAEVLFITQSSLSTRLKNLEQELGGPLFLRQRGSREMALTEAGKAFYELALQYEAITEKMLQVCHARRRCLRVSSLNSLGTFLLPEVYDRFMEQFPQVELQIQDMELESASRSLLAGTTDISFISGKTGNDHLLQTPLFKESMVLICSRSIPLQAPVALHDLRQYQELYIEWSNYFAQWHSKKIENGLPPLTISIMAHLRQFMDSKPCWAIVPLSVAMGLEKSCSIQILQARFPLPEREISMLTSADREGDSLIHDFVGCLKDILQNHPEVSTLL